MRSASIILFSAILFSVTIISCKRNRYKINTSSVDLKIEIRRLEKDLFSLDPGQVVKAIPDLEAEYDGFLQLFSYVINAGDVNDPSFGENLERFCTDRLNNEVYDSVMISFPGISWLDRDISRAFSHYRYYFPGKKVPRVYTCITGFNNSIIAGDSALGISLDMYLGANSQYYERLGIYRYLAARMTPDNILPDCMYGWGASEWDFSAIKYPVDNVLAEIIHEGKLKYFEKCMLPDVPDELIFGFTPSQFKFCRNNEEQMWQYLIEKNLLFSTDKFTIRKLTGEAPFTSYFTNESPGRAAVWVGFRIIESFMIRNPTTPLDELMKITDVQSILGKAKYNP
jgi:hypothetical protein